MNVVASTPAAYQLLDDFHRFLSNSEVNFIQCYFHIMSNLKLRMGGSGFDLHSPYEATIKYQIVP